MTHVSYFDHMYSACKAYGTDTKKIISVLLNNFISNNPETDLSPVENYPKFQDIQKDGSIAVDLNKTFPTTAIGTKVVSKTQIYSEIKRQINLRIKCTGPTTCWINGELVYQSNPDYENQRLSESFSLNLESGNNNFSIITEKTTIGLGFQIGPDNAIWEPVHFYRSENSLGFEIGLLEDKSFGYYEDFVVNWLPIESITPIDIEEQQVYLLKVPNPYSEVDYIYEGTGKLTLFLDHQNEMDIERSGSIAKQATEEYFHFLYFGSQMIEDIMQFHFSRADFFDETLFCGPLRFEDESEPDYSWKKLHTSSTGEKIYWRKLSSGNSIRMFTTTQNFGCWNYPMGVSLLGMNAVANYYNDQNVKQYVNQNMRQVKDYFNYCSWDHNRYRYLGVNSHLFWLAALDDCGSYGNTLLEVFKEVDDSQVDAISHLIGQFMSQKQRRESDGTFSRENNTMWIDDLYMSVPFLVRYWQRYGDDNFLQDAIAQFIGFKNRMFIKSEKLMSHVFDTITETPNEIPWSRGNGWVLFSLSELLNVLDSSNDSYVSLKQFYNQMIEGILEVQDISGLWHQVLDEDDTYLESSSTAMFICAISRGIRYGYIDAKLQEQAMEAAERAWNGLINLCVDRNGNLYGTCRGSGFSFSKTYYKQLGWRKNDTHGVGIVALAGVELEMLRDNQSE